MICSYASDVEVGINMNEERKVDSDEELKKQQLREEWQRKMESRRNEVDHNSFRPARASFGIFTRTSSVDRFLRHTPRVSQLNFPNSFRANVPIGTEILPVENCVDEVKSFRDGGSYHGPPSSRGSLGSGIHKIPSNSIRRVGSSSRRMMRVHSDLSIRSSKYEITPIG